MSLITKYRFDKKTKNEIIDEIYNYIKDEFSKGLDTDHNFIKATTLIKEIKDCNKPIELEHLLKCIKIENKFYTNESVATVATVISTLIALAAFISPLDKVLQLYVIFVIYFFILAFLKLRVFSPRGNKLNTAIFYIEQALKETKT